MSGDLERGFLEAIQAAPDDETPRLIYADWLEERGDVRCELLRMSVRIRHFPKDIVHHVAGFNVSQWQSLLDEIWPVSITVGKKMAQWADRALLPRIHRIDEIPDWWMWRERATAFCDHREFRRQVEALTNPPRPVSAVTAWSASTRSMETADVMANIIAVRDRFRREGGRLTAIYHDAARGTYHVHENGEYRQVATEAQLRELVQQNNPSHAHDQRDGVFDQLMGIPVVPLPVENWRRHGFTSEQEMRDAFTVAFTAVNTSQPPPVDPSILNYFSNFHQDRIESLIDYDASQWPVSITPGFIRSSDTADTPAE